MLLSQLENPKSALKDITYYSITSWDKKSKTGSGSGYKIAYKTPKNAYKQARKMIDTGLYDYLVIRENYVSYRDYNNEFSSSGCRYIWDRKKEVIKNDLFSS